MKWPNLRFYEDRQHLGINLIFSSKLSAFLTSEIVTKNSHDYNNAKIYFEMTFSLPSLLSSLKLPNKRSFGGDDVWRKPLKHDAICKEIRIYGPFSLPSQSSLLKLPIDAQ